MLYTVLYYAHRFLAAANQRICMVGLFEESSKALLFLLALQLAV